MTSEPTKADVLAWLESTGRSQGEAIVALWGRLSDTEHRKVAARVRKWTQRAREDGRQFATAAVGPRLREPQSEPPPPPPSPVTHAVLNLVAMERIPFLEAELARLQQDLDDARKGGELRLVPQLSRRAAETRESLDDARATQARQGVKLDRNVAAVARAILAEVTLIEREAGKTLAELALMSEDDVRAWGLDRA